MRLTKYDRETPYMLFFTLISLISFWGVIVYVGINIIHALVLK